MLSVKSTETVLVFGVDVLYFFFAIFCCKYCYWWFWWHSFIKNWLSKLSFRCDFPQIYPWPKLELLDIWLLECFMLIISSFCFLCEIFIWYIKRGRYIKLEINFSAALFDMLWEFIQNLNSLNVLANCLLYIQFFCIDWRFLSSLSLVLSRVFVHIMFLFARIGNGFIIWMSWVMFHQRINNNEGAGIER